MHDLALPRVFRECKQRVAGSNPASSTLRTLGIKLILRVFLFAFSARFHLESAKIVRANGTRMAQSRLSPVQRPAITCITESH